LAGLFEVAIIVEVFHFQKAGIVYVVLDGGRRTQGFFQERQRVPRVDVGGLGGVGGLRVKPDRHSGVLAPKKRRTQMGASW
jgi:hypothetical protein